MELYLDKNVISLWNVNSINIVTNEDGDGRLPQRMVEFTEKHHNQVGKGDSTPPQLRGKVI